VNYVARYFADEKGQSATEYILIIGLVIVPMALAFNEMLGAVKALVNKMARLLFGPGV
jgi:Flp pilus assembly pilin Flp